MKKNLYFFILFNSILFSSCNLINAMIPGTKPTNIIRDSITVSLTPEKKNQSYNWQTSIHYEDPYSVNDEITLSVIGNLDKSIYKDAVIQIEFQTKKATDEDFLYLPKNIEDEKVLSLTSETNNHNYEISIPKDNLDNFDKKLTFTILKAGSYFIDVYVYANALKTNGINGRCQKTLYFDCCE